MAVYAEHGITAMPLPPNMTDLLQPMDLVVNAPLKAAIRQARGKSVYDAQQTYRSITESLLAEGKPYESFHPPKPTLHDGLVTFMVTLLRFTEAKFEASLRACFAKVGLSPAVGGQYPVYERHEHTILQPKPEKQVRAAEAVSDSTATGAVAAGSSTGTDSAGTAARPVPGSTRRTGASAAVGSTRPATVVGGSEQADDDEHTEEGDSDRILRWVAGETLNFGLQDSSDDESEDGGGDCE